MNETQQHYFSDSPEAEFVPREVSVWLADRSLSVTTAPGIFSPEGVDRGTKVLLEALPTVSGNVLDIGCGWGAISIHTSLSSPDATVYGIDVNTRALELACKNAADLGLKNVHVYHADEVQENVTFKQIRSNPPIRIGKEALHAILHKWLPRLDSGGDAYLVVAKHLGAESLTKWINNSFPDFEAVRHSRNKGFHVIKASKA